MISACACGLTCKKFLDKSSEVKLRQVESSRPLSVSVNDSAQLKLKKEGRVIRLLGPRAAKIEQRSPRSYCHVLLLVFCLLSPPALTHLTHPPPFKPHLPSPLDLNKARPHPAESKCTRNIHAMQGYLNLGDGKGHQILRPGDRAHERRHKARRSYVTTSRVRSIVSIRMI